MNRWIARILDRAPMAVAGIFTIALLVSIGAVRDSLNSHADFVSAPVMAEGLAHAGQNAKTVLGDYRWFEALWLLRATSWLPAHFAVWEAVPFVVWLGLLVCVGVAVLRVTRSRWAASITVSLLICMGVDLRSTLWSLNTHGPAAFHVALVGLATVVALGSPRWRRGLRGYGGAFVLGLITALGATDPLVVPLALGPLGLVAVAMWLRRHDAALFRLTVIVGLLTLGGAHVLNKLGADAMITYTGRVVSWVAQDAVVTHVGWLPSAYTYLATNNVYGAPVDRHSGIPMIGGFIAIVAVIAILWIAVRTAVRDFFPERFAPAAAPAPVTLDLDAVAAGEPAGPAPRAIEPLDAERPATVDLLNARDGLIVFWAAVMIVNLMLWSFTGSPIGPASGRYLVSSWVGVCVLLPVFALRLDLRWLASLAALGICLSATYVFIREPRSNAGYKMPSGVTARKLEAFAARYDVDHGFAAYWDATPITWHTRFKLQVWPINPCATAEAPGQNCRFFQHTVSSWYLPRPGRRALFFTDTAQPDQPTLDPRYGKPIATLTIGTITAYIVPNDPAPFIA